MGALRYRVGVFLACLAVLVGQPARSQETFHHGVSLTGELRYPAGFAHFDYVNPGAPKGGELKLAATGTTARA